MPIHPGLIDHCWAMLAVPNDAPVLCVDLPKADWGKVAGYCKNHFSGIIAQGTPTSKQAKELLRVLKPGAHMLLIAPDEDPTGEIGRHRIWDAGFAPPEYSLPN